MDGDSVEPEKPNAYGVMPSENAWGEWVVFRTKDEADRYAATVPSRMYIMAEGHFDWPDEA